jgi:transposase-like protein
MRGLWAIRGAWMRLTSKSKGQWVYLYRAVDKAGRTVDFLLSRRRDMAATTP